MNRPAQSSEPKCALYITLNWLFRFLVVSLWVMSAFGQEVKVYVSSEAGDRLTPKLPVWFVRQKRATGPLFRIMTGNMFQRIAGFGASFQEAGMICLNALPRTKQEAVLRSLFDPDQGAGFSVMNTPIAATGFSSAGPWYSYDPTPGDVLLKNFSIERDLGPDGLITYIRRAHQHGQFALQAAMDYPPDWMFADSAQKQDVDPKYYDALARYYLRYVQEYQRQGIFIKYLSLFNEPGTGGAGYTQISYPEICQLLKNHVGPLFKKEGVRTQIMLSEAPNRQDALKDYPVVLNDAQARQYVDALPYHGDGSAKLPGDFGKIAALRRRYGDLPLWMMGPPDVDTDGAFHSTSLPQTDFKEGAFWGNMIVSDLKAGASAWVYGNMILDQHGGPWLVSPVHRDHDPNPRQPLIIINRQTGKVSYTGIYYYLAHFSRFLRPGAIRALLDGKYPGLRGVAFLSPDPAGRWRWVVELLNDRPTDVPVQVDFALDWVRRSLDLTLRANSITTCVWKPLSNSLGNMPIN